MIRYLDYACCCLVWLFIQQSVCLLWLQQGRPFDHNLAAVTWTIRQSVSDGRLAGPAAAVMVTVTAVPVLQ